MGKVTSCKKISITREQTQALLLGQLWLPLTNAVMTSWMIWVIESSPLLLLSLLSLMMKIKITTAMVVIWNRKKGHRQIRNLRAKILINNNQALISKLRKPWTISRIANLHRTKNLRKRDIFQSYRTNPSKKKTIWLWISKSSSKCAKNVTSIKI